MILNHRRKRLNMINFGRDEFLSAYAYLFLVIIFLTVCHRPSLPVLPPCHHQTLLMSGQKDG